MTSSDFINSSGSGTAGFGTALTGAVPNAAVQAAVGATDFRAGLRHYLLYGRPEGRHGAP